MKIDKYRKENLLKKHLTNLKEKEEEITKKKKKKETWTGQSHRPDQRRTVGQWK